MRNLVLQGGGVHGYALIGAVEELSLKRVKRFAGASVGALLAFALVCGKKPREIFDKVVEIDKKMLTGSRSWLYAAYCFLKHWGFYSSSNVKKWMRRTLCEWIGDDKITFAQSKQRFKKEIHVVVTSVGHADSLVISHLNYPDMQVVDALAMSMNIPLFYKPIRFENDLICDGGFINNTPLHVFDNERNGYFNRHTLALCSLTDDELKLATSREDGQAVPVNSLLEYCKRLIHMIFEYASRNYDREQDDERQIIVRVGNVWPFDFDLSLDAKQKLYDCGRQSVIDAIAVPHSKSSL